MRDDVPEVALRLACLFSESGKVRTHTRPDETPRRGGVRIKSPRAMKPGVGRGGNQGNPVIIGGTQYKNLKSACETLHVGHRTIYAMLKDGRATRCITQRS